MFATFINRPRLYIAMFIAPLLFVGFFSHQVYLVVAYDLSVWKGGGMGMFSSPDHPSKRHLFMYVINESGQEKVVVPNFYNSFDAYFDFTTLPHPKFLQEIQEAFFAKTLYVSHETESAIWLTDVQQHPAQQPLSPTKIRLELWKMHHIDGKANTTSIQADQIWEFH